MIDLIANIYYKKFTPYLSFGVWVTSFKIIFPSPIHLTINIFVFNSCVLLQFVVYYIVFIHFSVVGLLSHFKAWASMNRIDWANVLVLGWNILCAYSQVWYSWILRQVDCYIPEELSHWFALCLYKFDLQPATEENCFTSSPAWAVKFVSL